MCGRYFMGEDDVREYAADIAQMNRRPDGGADICPGMQAPAILGGDAAIKRMRWGFERPQGGLVINARVETIGEKPMFRALARTQRCAMPARGYYEWRRSDRQKFDIALADARRFWLAGLWRAGGDGMEFVVLTQPPVDAVAPVHNRMPLLLPDADALGRWLAGETPLYAESAALRVAAQGPEQLMMRF